MSITCFNDLSDLVLIELLSYLSSFDILWGLTRLNQRLTMLIIERGFFHHINLSSARYEQFKTIVDFLPLNEIESIVIDTDASPLQLTHWPYLPRLRTLRIVGPYDLDDLLIFLLLHAATITNLIIKSNRRLVPVSITWFIHRKDSLMLKIHFVNEEQRSSWNFFIKMFFSIVTIISIEIFLGWFFVVIMLSKR